MIASQRRVHWVVWTFVAPAAVLAVVLLLVARPAGPARGAASGARAGTGASE